MNRFNLLLLASTLTAISGAGAIEPAFQYLRYEDSQILTRLNIADSLPSELIAYINKGVPISSEYALELWRVRPGWLDEMVDRVTINYRIRFDSWEKEYTVVQAKAGLVIENTLYEEAEAIELLTSSGQVAFAANDTSGEFYLTGSIIIRTMSFSNFREVESWLKGEVSDIKKPNLDNAPNKVGEFIFNMALKISGLKNYSGEMKTAAFRPGNLVPSKSMAK